MQILRDRNKERKRIGSFSRWGLIGIVFSFLSLLLALSSFVDWISSSQSPYPTDTKQPSHQSEFVLGRVDNDSANVSQLKIEDRFSYISLTDNGKNLPFRNLIENSWGFYETNENITEYSFIIEPVYKPKSVYIFINLENGYSEINNQLITGKQIGHIDFEFSDFPKLTYLLFAGNNIREWLIGANKDIVSTTTATNVYEVYQGKHYKDENMTGIFDVIVIEFNSLPTNSPLIKVRIYDDSSTILGSDNPRLLIMGVVVEK